MSTSVAETIEFPMAEAEAFMEKLADTLNAGALASMLSIGHKTRLLDTMAGMAPATSQQIADAAGLNERYVREWLAAMVTGGVVTYNPAERSYELPQAHAACLTRDAALGNMAVYAQFIPMTGSLQEQLIDCFKTGEGTRYEDYPCFHTMMAEDSGQTVVAQLFDTVLPLVPEAAARLEKGIAVLDAGCGSAGALIAMAKRFPASRFTGYDLCAEAIENGKKAATEAGLGNVWLEAKDLTGFSEPERYDLITSFDAIHDQKDPQGLLKGIHAALRPGGVYLVQDIGGSAYLENNLEFPMATFLYTASCMHCTPVSLGQGGEGLGTMWGWETAEKMLRQAGFASIERHVLPHDPMNVWFVCRKSI